MPKVTQSGWSRFGVMDNKFYFGHDNFGGVWETSKEAPRSIWDLRSGAQERGVVWSHTCGFTFTDVKLISEH